jgi:phosphatidate cytidylyltransferase
MSPNLARRLLVAAIGIPAALGIVYLGGWVLTGALALLALVGCHEVFRLSERGGVRPLAAVGYAGALLAPCLAFAVLPQGAGLQPAAAALAGALWLMAVMAAGAGRRSPSERPLAAVAITVFGPRYAGGLPAFLLLLRHGAPTATPWAATWLVFLPLALTWICDTLAMAGGSLVGGRKLAPVLSPNKTWAGALSGTAGALLLAPLYGFLLLEPVGISLESWQLVLFGAAVSVAGQVGDVAESLFKREAGVKDSGAFFPGHGGVLDRLDSLYWAIPTAALLLAGYGTL